MIDNFRGDYFFLSNFSSSPLLFASMEWPTVEHAYQAWKSREWPIREMIQKLPTAAKARKAGRSLPRRRDWNQIKSGLMLTLLRCKFSQSKELAEKLLATGDEELVEGNDWGCVFWGMVKGADGKWTGENMLGKLLMQVRGELREIFLD